MSCVRSNTKGVIGFLRDERRLNVALTRAKYGLIMVGDKKCLQNGDKLWKEYLQYLDSKKLYMIMILLANRRSNREYIEC